MNAFEIMDLNKKLLDVVDQISSSSNPFETMELNKKFNDIYDQINNTTTEIKDEKIINDETIVNDKTTPLDISDEAISIDVGDGELKAVGRDKDGFRVFVAKIYGHDVFIAKTENENTDGTLNYSWSFKIDNEFNLINQIDINEYPKRYLAYDAAENYIANKTNVIEKIQVKHYEDDVFSYISSLSKNLNEHGYLTIEAKKTIANITNRQKSFRDKNPQIHDELPDFIGKTDDEIITALKDSGLMTVNTAIDYPPEYYKLNELLALTANDFINLDAEQNKEKFNALIIKQAEIAAGLDNAYLLDKFAPLAIEVGEHITELKVKTMKFLLNKNAEDLVL